MTADPFVISKRRFDEYDWVLPPSRFEGEAKDQVLRSRAAKTREIDEQPKREAITVSGQTLWMIHKTVAVSNARGRRIFDEGRPLVAKIGFVTDAPVDTTTAVQMFEEERRQFEAAVASVVATWAQGDDGEARAGSDSEMSGERDPLRLSFQPPPLTPPPQTTPLELFTKPLPSPPTLTYALYAIIALAVVVALELLTCVFLWHRLGKVEARLAAVERTQGKTAVEGKDAAAGRPATTAAPSSNETGAGTLK